MDDGKIKIGIIVTYTEKKEKANKSSALGWYSKNLYEEMDHITKKNIVILSNIKKDKGTFEENGLFIDECWRRGSMFFWLDLIREIKKYPNLKLLHIQHEFNQFGGLFTIPLSLIFLFIANTILGKKIIITFHGVISQKIIDKNFIEINNLFGLPFLIKIVFKTFYKTAHWFLSQTIVHEEPFKTVLEEEYKHHKPVSVIPIGVEEKKICLSKEKARDELNIKNKNIILYFGFLAGYKGIDLLIDAFNKLKNNDYFLIIAGGKPARVEHDEKYQSWFNKIEEKCKQNANIRMTGFLEEEDLEKYFVASDLTVFPYLFPLSASGAITKAIAYKIPFIVSDSFRGVIDEKFIFEKNPENLKNKILEFFIHDKKEYNEYVKMLKEKRSWKNSAEKTEKIYNTLLN
jgi:glycosyltransferase involved in cell wall biosynthesis